MLFTYVLLTEKMLLFVTQTTFANINNAAHSVNLAFRFHSLVLLLRWQEFALGRWRCFVWHATAVSVPVPVVGAACRSVICPVPFPSRLITTHASTAAAVVNNTMFYDATRSSPRLVAWSRRRWPRSTVGFEPIRVLNSDRIRSWSFRSAQV